MTSSGRSRGVLLSATRARMPSHHKEGHVAADDLVPRHDALQIENRVVPLYHQIQQLIRHRVAKNHYAPGSQIPSEHELCRELKVSRITVREALKELVRE